jgi:hypothetical protein
MVRNGLTWLVGVVVVTAFVVQVAPLRAQAASTSLGSVRIPAKVTANGQPLAAGTYVVRLTDDPVSPVVGQTPTESHWVEFLQGGQVKGRELAIVLSSDEAKQISEGRPPVPGATLVQRLKGNDYIRVWVNRGGTNYLVHLAVGPSF